jgi:hypothetical protein
MPTTTLLPPQIEERHRKAPASCSTPITRTVQHRPANRKILFTFGAVAVLAMLNMVPAIHSGIISADTHLAYTFNSVLSINPTFDKLLGILNTRLGDLFVLSCLCFCFFAHISQGTTFTEKVRRASFWLWVGILLVVTYLFSCVIEDHFNRATPLEGLSNLKSVITMYGIVPHSSANESYPSGHGLAYIFFVLMAWRPYRKMALCIAAVGTVMLSMRLIIGLHWLSDIALGSLPLAAMVTCLLQETKLKKSYYFARRFALLLIVKAWKCRWPFANSIANRTQV